MLLKHFEADYEKLFGRSVDGMEVEVTVWSVNAYTQQDSAERIMPPSDRHVVHSDLHRAVLDPAKGVTASAAIITRDNMDEGAQAAGPCIIVEDESSVIVPPSRNILAHQDGTLDMTAKQGEADHG